jgi:FAD/FMN-containing dehydrogenase
VADGNLQAEIVGPAPDDATVDEAVLGVVRELGGSVSAEHGIGLAKTAYLSWCRSPAEIAAMRAVKAALGPAGLLAPGVLLP